jgi:hypothetical protein
MCLAGLMLLLALAAPRAAHAQRVDGQLRDAETGAPIVGATLGLLDAQGQAVATAQSGPRGLFTLRAPQPGLYRIQASRLGYRQATSGTVDLTAGTEIEVELRLSSDAVRLDPLTVTGIPRYERLEQSGFYSRRDQFGPDGLKSAIFLEQHDIERMNAFQVNDIFDHVPGVRTHRGGITMRRDCTPAIVVNGVLSTQGIGPLMPPGISGARGSRRQVSTPRSLVGVEVYTGSAVPSQWMADAAGCGVIMYWTK